MARARLTAVPKLLVMVLCLTMIVPVASAEGIPESHRLVGSGRLTVWFGIFTTSNYGRLMGNIGQTSPLHSSFST